MGRVVLSAVLSALAFAIAAALAAPPASASRYARFGVQDDGWLLYGPGTLDQRLDTLQQLGVGIVRVTIRWDQIAPQRPLDPRDPYDPGYHWNAYDLALRGLHQRHIPALVTIWGSPPWANGGHAPRWLPRFGIGDFAYAAARRWPWVRLWTAWNEPNSALFADPVSPKLYVRRVLDPTYAAIHQADPHDKLAGGVTSPRKTPSGMSPTAFMLGMRRSGARLDAYAQNPYPSSPRETPFTTPCPWCRTLTMARLPRIRREVTLIFGRTPIWLTEYGYQTSPPDRLLGVSFATQDRYIGEAALRVYRQAGVSILIHFLVQDEPEAGGWQSGLELANGVRKPSFRAFALPLVQVSRHRRRTVVWGQVRPGRGRRAYRLQRWNGLRWVGVGGFRRTNAHGAFTRVLSGYRGEKLRTVAPEASFAGPALRVR